jgi:hypothetical protein
MTFKVTIEGVAALASLDEVIGFDDLHHRFPAGAFKNLSKFA